MNTIIIISSSSKILGRGEKEVIILTIYLLLAVHLSAKAYSIKPFLTSIISPCKFWLLITLLFLFSVVQFAFASWITHKSPINCSLKLLMVVSASHSLISVVVFSTFEPYCFLDSSFLFWLLDFTIIVYRLIERCQMNNYIWLGMPKSYRKSWNHHFYLKRTTENAFKRCST